MPHQKVRCECAERGDLLEQVGSIFQRVVSILHHCSSSCAKENQGSSRHLVEAASRERVLQQQRDDLKGQLAEKEKVLLKFHSKVMDSGVSLAVSDSLSRSAKENFENARRLNPPFILHRIFLLSCALGSMFGNFVWVIDFEPGRRPMHFEIQSPKSVF